MLRLSSTRSNTLLIFCCYVPKLSIPSSWCASFNIHITKNFQNLVLLLSHKVHITRTFFCVFISPHFCISHPPYDAFARFIWSCYFLCFTYLYCCCQLVTDNVTLPWLMSHRELQDPIILFFIGKILHFDCCKSISNIHIVFIINVAWNEDQPRVIKMNVNKKIQNYT